MVTYDGARTREYADRLHRSASQTVLGYVLGGVATGASLGVVAGDLRTPVIAAVLVGIVGYLIGTGKAFKLRLEAQLALCQVQIEENTRAARGAPPERAL